MQKKVLGFDTSAGLPLLASHVFFTTPDGQLGHEIDGRLRATVPPEGWADYAREWPEAADVIAALKKPAAPAGPTDAEKLAAALAEVAALKAAAQPVYEPQGDSNAVADQTTL